MTTPAFILLILDPSGREDPDACNGPTFDGACPGAVAGEPVPCAGRRLVPAHSDVRSRTCVAVPAAADECPLPLMAAGGG